jgi:hypothetical protein
VVAGLGATVGFFVEGAGATAASVPSPTAATDLAAGGVRETGARLAELSAPVRVGVAMTGAGATHPAISRAVATETARRVVESIVLLNS